MKNILLVEPDYRSKFPPLGLMRISAFHKESDDYVTFVRGKEPAYRMQKWDRIYVSSLFTWELPRTVSTIEYYHQAVKRPSDVIVGGIGATLMPEYIKDRTECTVMVGALDKPGMLGADERAVASYAPDHSILGSVNWAYRPRDSYFCRVTKGCVRNCQFCAVPRLEPVFGYNDGLTRQVGAIAERYGEQQHLVLLDNNILASERFLDTIDEIKSVGFASGAKRNGRLRTVDFNQGIDARYITAASAKALASIALSPVRLAFDFDGMENEYRAAVGQMAQVGFREFTNYVLFNFRDDPASLYRRLSVNLEMSQRLNIRVTGFPMRYIPIDDVNRRHVSASWRWRYLRGIQCILLATHGVVSPHPDFFTTAFGSTCEEFLEILAMPDRYIIYRNLFKDNEAAEWKSLYSRLSSSEQENLLNVLAQLNRAGRRRSTVSTDPKFRPLLRHYYPREYSVTPS